MDSFSNLWRANVTTDESESENDLVVDSKSDIGILLPDSDNEMSFFKEDISQTVSKMKQNKSNSSEFIVPSSDEDDNVSNFSCYSNTDSSGKSANPIKNIISSSFRGSLSPIQQKSLKNKNKYKILDSDDEDTTKQNQYEVVTSSNEEIASISENTHEMIKSESSLNCPSPFLSENACSSTFINEVDNLGKANAINESKFNIKESSNTSCNKTTHIPSIDLTVAENLSNNEWRRSKNKSDNRNDEEVIVIDSDSDEPKKSIDKSTPHSPGHQRTSTSVYDKPQKKGKNIIPVQGNQTSCNDYFSRVESLKAEETKLKMLVADVLKSIETTKSTLKTANLSALPDRGVRLQMFLKKQESKLRDLRYQQSTLGNEILKLQFASNTLQPKEQIKIHPIQDKMFKLPMVDTDLNAMGQRALETHRVQQALTVDTLKTLHNSLRNYPSEDFHVPDPKGLRVQLMPHQKYGLTWSLWREKEKPSGGILADDMGLGKTLTMISLILKSNEDNEISDGNTQNENSGSCSDEEHNSNWMTKERSKSVRGKTLIVCPATLLGQWEGEINNKVKRGILDVLVYHGPSREKRTRRLARLDVVITTYNLVSRESEESESPLFAIRWDRIILDEAHQIRNYKTKVAQTVFKLKAKSRWALTGTPVHNKEIDFYALLKFLRCSPFDDLAVWKKWVDNRDAAGIQRLNTITKSLMLRRTKQGLQEKGELKSLTNKKIHTMFVALDKEEQEGYEKLLNFSKSLFAQFLAQKAEKENALTNMAGSKASHYLQNIQNPFENHPHLARLHSQMKEITDIKSHHILVLLLRLRQFCCHPALIKSMLNSEDVKTVGVEDDDGLDIDMMDKLTRMSIAVTEKEESKNLDADISLLSCENMLYAEERLNSKMKKVLDTLQEILNGDDKLIVVSQWVSLLNLMNKVLQERNVKCVNLTGSVPVKDRAMIVDRFNKKGCDPRVMLLSLTAGGVGLNLVGGNHLLLLDLHWNPQLEKQACDRIYRVGQEKNVQIYKFISSETIEERILSLQEKKIEIANDILMGSKVGSKLSLDDLKTLFQMT